MVSKHWIARAVQSLEESLSPVPHESNEIDWKVSLSERKERLAEHLMAFANHPNGGFLTFGVGTTATCCATTCLRSDTHRQTA